MGDVRRESGDFIYALQELSDQGQRYGCIEIDPPWPYGFGDIADGGYDLMSLHAMRHLRGYLHSVAAPASFLWTWTTTRFIREACDMVEFWGWEVRNILPWLKLNKSGSPYMGLGSNYRHSLEYVLFCTRRSKEFEGKFPRPKSWKTKRNFFDMEKEVGAHFEWKRGAHSRKPDRAMQFFRDESPGPHLSIFARDLREGWDCVGNEVPGGYAIWDGEKHSLKL